MAADPVFALLRVDLGLAAGSVPEGVKNLMHTYIDAARAELLDAGIAVDEAKAEDLNLLVMYAAWLYRSRIHQTDKPLMLQRLLRNRQASQITGGGA